MSKIPVSVIVIATNEGKRIIDVIKSLENQTFKNFEVIFVVPRNTITSTILENYLAKRNIFFKYKIVNDPGMGAGLARNIGLEQATGRYLIFLDGDTRLAKNTIHTLYKILKYRKEVGSVNPLFFFEERRRWYRILNKLILNYIYFYIMYFLNNILNLKVGYTLCLACRREHAIKTMFKNVWPGEDLDFIYRLNKQFGGRHIFTKKTVIYTLDRRHTLNAQGIKAVKNIIVQSFKIAAIILYFIILRKPPKVKYIKFYMRSLGTR